MAFQATVYRILIASPSDVTAERKAIPEAISSWNATHSEDYGVVLVPVMWETHSTPEMGDRPQAIINKQIVGSCDLLVGAFWTRIGTRTGVAESGTVEEINEIKSADKPILIYFSSAPVVPDSVDPEQYKRLTDFKKKCQSEGLTEKYDSISELRGKLLRHLTNTIRKIHGEPTFTPTETDEGLGSVSTVKDQFMALITRAEVDWKTERDSEPVSVDEGKYIIERLFSDLIDFRAALSHVVEEAMLDNFDSQISNLKKLRDHRLTLDGGKSYKAFWENGDKIFDYLKILVADVTYKPESGEKSSSNIVGGLEEEKVKILKMLAEAEECGREEKNDSEISRSLGLSILVTRYHLETLEEDDYIYVSYAMNQPPLYSIDQKGRDFLIKNGLL
jgi:DNA-binding transcriptional ArsR family regulator